MNNLLLNTKLSICNTIILSVATLVRLKRVTIEEITEGSRDQRDR